MYRFYLLPLLAVVGLIAAIRTVILSSVPQLVQPPLAEPAHSSYESFVAGSAIVEALSENISVATPLSAVVKEVLVKPGDSVEAGAVLIALDDRDAVAERNVREADLLQAKAQLAEAEKQFNLYEALADRRAVSQDQFITRQFASARTKAGVDAASARLDATKTLLERLLIRAPISGTILQVKIKKGEFASAQVLATPLILMGNTQRLAVRVDIDENDAWRVEPGRPATAYLRGNRDIMTLLSFERFEPYIVPKRSLTGDSSERVDTRVLQVIYSFPKNDLPIFVGQLMDVFIEAKGISKK